MPVYRDPWRNLEERVARSIESGMERPLALSADEQWVRDFRARMRLRRPTTSRERAMADEQSVADAAATANADDADGADAKNQASLAEGDSAACDALVAATTENPGAPFAPDIVRDLAALKRANRVQFEIAADAAEEGRLPGDRA